MVKQNNQLQVLGWPPLPLVSVSRCAEGSPRGQQSPSGPRIIYREAVWQMERLIRTLSD